MNRRILINLIAFIALFVGLCAWAATNIVSFDFLEHPFTITAEFTTSPGLQPNFEVTYLGHAIGKIGPVALEGDHVTAKLKIDKGTKIPGGLSASVRRKSAVGEPYVELEALPDQTGFPPELKGGVDIPVERTSTPLAYSQLFSALDQLVAAIPPDDLHTVVHELVLGVQGRSDDFRTIVQSAADATTTFADNADTLDKVVTDLTTLTSTIALHREALGAGIDNVAALSQTLAANRDNISTLLGQTFTTKLAVILETSQDNITCLVDSLGVVVAGLDTPEHKAELDQLFSVVPIAEQALQDAFVEPGEDGADGPFLDGTFVINDGTQVLPHYDPKPQLPTPLAVPDCAATHVPANGAGAGNGTAGGGSSNPNATPGNVDVPDRVTPTETFPDSSKRGLGPDSPLKQFVDIAKTLLPFLIVLGLLTLLYVKRPWRRFAGGAAKGEDDGPAEPPAADEEDALT